MLLKNKKKIIFLVIFTLILLIITGIILKSNKVEALSK